MKTAFQIALVTAVGIAQETISDFVPYPTTVYNNYQEAITQFVNAVQTG